MLVCLATLPAVLFAFLIAGNERASTLTRTEETAYHVLDLISREHFYQMAGARSLLRWLADNMKENQAGREYLAGDSTLLKALLAGYPQLANIAVLTPTGEVVGSAHPLPAALNMLDYSAIRKALISQTIETGTYVIGPIVNRPILHLAYAVRDARKQVAKIVFIAIDLQWLSRLASQIELPAEHILIIVDRDGGVLASSAKPSVAAVTIGTKIPELAENRRRGQSEMRALINGHMRRFTLSPMEGLPGVMIASGLPYEQIYQKANDEFYRMIGLLILLTFCTVFCVILFEEVALIRYLRILSGNLRRFGAGDYAVRITVPPGNGELQEMARTFNAMAETLAIRHKDLREAHDRLDLLTRHLQIARETEAQRISRDLHDEAGQILTSLKIDLSGLQKKCRQCRTGDGNGALVEAHMGAMSEKIDDIVGFIRRLSAQLRPPVLDKIGLPAAIEKLAAEIEAHSALAIEVEITGKAPPVGGLVPITLYRIVQEALTNIVRHAQATLTGIHLHRDEYYIVLTIRDDGKGLSAPEGGRESLGIIGMRERAHLVGGKFSIGGVSGKGTLITVEIPYTDKREGKHENYGG